MENEMTYTRAFEKLEALVEQLEDGEVELEELAAKIKEANSLIEFCETKLRKISQEIDEATGAATARKDK